MLSSRFGRKSTLTFSMEGNRHNFALIALLVSALLTVTAAPIRPWTTASPVDCTYETQGEHDLLLSSAVTLVATITQKHNVPQTCICYRKVLTEAKHCRQMIVSDKKHGRDFLGMYVTQSLGQSDKERAYVSFY